jgi:hypothetical protein
MASSRPATDLDEPTPRWVKVFGIIALVVFVAFVILHLAGGGPRAH